MTTHVFVSDMALGIANFFTSSLTAITGMGGGTILIALMPFFLPASVIVPLHGATQIASNVSRAYFSRKDLDFELVLPFFVGAIVGAVVLGFLVKHVSLEIIPLLIGLYILATQWSKWINQFMARLDNFYVLGFVMMGVGLFVGAVGPMHMPRLIAKYGASKAVAVGSVLMSLVHTGKVVVYSVLSFRFLDYWHIVVVMVVAATLGSYAGVAARSLIPASLLKTVTPYLLSLMAIKLILDYAFKHIF